MKYTYDFEFIEDGKTIEPISMGMVNMDTGSELYIVFNDFDSRKVAKNNWLMENVMPSIDHTTLVTCDFQGKPLVRDLIITDPNSVDREEGAQRLMEFVHDDPTEIEWWNWYGAYDHVALCQLFGKMIDLPNGFPMYSNDIKQLHKLAGWVAMPKQPGGLHNALEDARFNVVRYNYLWELLTEKK
jgi:hypothetical protein